MIASRLATALLFCAALAACGSTASPTPSGPGGAAAVPAACSVLTADDMFYYLGSHFTATPGTDAATCAYHRADGTEDAVLTIVGNLDSVAASTRLGSMGTPAPDLAIVGIDEAACSPDGHTVAARAGGLVVSVSYTNTSGAPSQCALRSVSWSLARVALGVLGGQPHPSPYPTD